MATGSTGRITTIKRALVKKRTVNVVKQEEKGAGGEDQPLAEKLAHFFDIVGGTDHQLAGLVLVVVAERKTLDFGEQFVAEVKGDAL
jgi:hypothetical protein